MLWGLVGVALFGLTLPFTRLAVAGLDPIFVALGRAVVAAALAAAMLRWHRTPFPGREHWPRLAVAALGVVVGFPIAATIAMTTVPASHGAVVLGLLPIGTALAGTLRGGERPSPAFWLCALAGSAVVTWFALREGGGRFVAADLWLALAVACASIGYAEGAVVSRALGGWQTISWILVLSAPVLLLPVAVLAWRTDPGAAGLSAWIGFAYVSVFSMFVGFFAWYRGLALGGTARVGQIQLLQGFFTLVGAAAFAGERIGLEVVLFCVAVVAIVAIGRRMPVARTAASPR
ncbi:MAG: DMT family transporter [Alphaproteobacteria bacterium]|nr:DMT family transporter [Alphaproteobacteria bacterium]